MTSCWSKKSGLKLEKFSADNAFIHRLIISQPEKGYRFSIDPLILSAHIHPKRNEKIMDLGCGCGIISLVLAYRYPDIEITGIEIQKELYTFARQNVLANGFERRIHVVHDDIKNIKFTETGTRADIIVSNPPYKKIGTGRLNLDFQKAMARHEITLDIDMLIECSSRLIKNQGSLFIVFPFDRLQDLTQALSRHDFFPEFIRYVHVKADTKASRVIVCAVKNGNRQCSSPSSLFIYTLDNKFTEEYLSLFRP
ncbi:MAG: hypothetical protein A2097_09255 [Desulfobacula sp. GWF2_41_7]|nr:MAG: hypothetical protein A2097_09255 [Desulfobacula sp. GWF2_41_7]